MSLFSKKQSVVPPRRRSRSDTPERATSASLDQRYNFRRNSTLTGSASSRVSTVGEAHAQLKSERVRAHDLVQQRRHVGVILFGVILASALLYGLVSQFTAHVEVHTADVSVQLGSSYTAAIEQYYKQQPIERFRFMLNQAHLNSFVQSMTPEVGAVSLDGSAGLGKARFTLTMRRPIAGWSMGGSQEYVDGDGISFTHNYFATPAVQIVDNSGVQVAAGQAIASNQFLSFVGRVVGQATKRGLTVTQVIIPQGTTRQIELGLKGIAYPVKLSVDRPAGEQVEDMARSIAWLTSHGTSPQYLDVRTSGRAFYL
jgi:hypothetical protein